MAAAVACGARGPTALEFLALAVAAALPVVLLLARSWRRSVGWLLLTSGAAAVGMVAAVAAPYGPVPGRSFPVGLADPGDGLAAVDAEPARRVHEGPAAVGLGADLHHVGAEPVGAGLVDARNRTASTAERGTLRLAYPLRGRK